ncbi:alpha/beta fold hydrolase [Micromonosporaceae bacterium Da 78-11]
MIRREVCRAGVRLSALCGDGERGLVVLLHGLAGSAAEMAPLATALGSDGYRVVAVDQRGHGHSTRRPDDLSRAAYVADVVAFLDEPAWLVGQSMGAQTAMLVAAGRPDLVRGLVMIEGGVGGSTDDYPTRLGKWFAGWPVPFADEAAALGFLGDTAIGRAWTADLERRPDGLWPRFDAEVMETAIRGVAETARWAQWAAVTAPTLVMHGAEGNQDPTEVRRMLTMPGVRHVVVADAGHDVHLDQPTVTYELIRDFLNT